MALLYALLLLTAYISSSGALPPCVCGRDLVPVCGSDDVTYPNECTLKCQQVQNPELTLKKQGSCEPLPPVCICPMNYAPVCGSDGKTYGNECDLTCSKAIVPDLEMKYNGECQTESVQVAEPKVPEQVQVAEPKVPGEQVQVAEPKVPGDQVQVAEPNIPESCICTRLYEPVCGTDSLTYANSCLLNCASKTSPREINVDHDGPCDPTKVKVAEYAENTPDCVCTRDLKPVCGSDGVTYNNVCLLNCAGKQLSVKNVGPCVN